MSIVIIGGNDRMVRRYSDICKEYNCTSKVFTQPTSNLDGMIGTPDMIILFTNPVSHKMIRVAKKRAAQKDIAIVQSHCGSCNSLRNILSTTVKKSYTN